LRQDVQHQRPLAARRPRRRVERWRHVRRLRLTLASLTLLQAFFRREIDGLASGAATGQTAAAVNIF